MNDYAQFWARLRAPLLSLGEWGPAAFLVVSFTLVSIISYRGVLPVLYEILPVETDAWRKQIKGLWAAVFAAVFAAATTPVALENTLVALFSGAAIIALRNVNRWGPVLVEYMRGQLMGPLVLLALLPVLGCGAKMPADEPAYQTCTKAAWAAKNAEADRLCPASVEWDTCEHRPAIMARLQKAQEACR